MPLLIFYRFWHLYVIFSWHFAEVAKILNDTWQVNRKANMAANFFYIFYNSIKTCESKFIHVGSQSDIHTCNPLFACQLQTLISRSIWSAMRCATHKNRPHSSIAMIDCNWIFHISANGMNIKDTIVFRATSYHSCYSFQCTDAMYILTLAHSYCLPTPFHMLKVSYE